jgi:hypothetical protein
MADKKISALTGATTPLAGTEVLPIVQSGSTVKVAVSDLTAGRAISATELTLSTGNVIVANGQGIDFSATPGTGTSELFADYETGTWTPTDGSGAGLTFSVALGTYTKIGNMVYAAFHVVYPITASGSSAIIAGLPFANTTYPTSTQMSGAFLNYTSLSSPFFGLTFSGASSVSLYTVSATTITNLQLSGGQARMTVIYQTA